MCGADAGADRDAASRSQAEVSLGEDRVDLSPRCWRTEAVDGGLAELALGEQFPRAQPTDRARHAFEGGPQAHADGLVGIAEPAGKIALDQAATDGGIEQQDGGFHDAAGPVLGVALGGVKDGHDDAGLSSGDR